MDNNQRINSPICHEYNPHYVHDITDINGVRTISSQMIIEHCQYVNNVLLSEIRKIMIDENIPEMYIFNDSWIKEAFQEKIERERRWEIYDSTNTNKRHNIPYQDC